MPSKIDEQIAAPAPILFISRNYPPQVGGLEVYSYELIHAYEKHAACRKIVLSKSKKHLAWFFPYCLFRAFHLIRTQGISIVHLCDGLLAPVGVLLKCFTRSRISITIHGLDITYPHRIYQKLIPWCVRKLDAVICPSRSTAEQCFLRGISEQKTAVIPNGVRADVFKSDVPFEILRLRLAKKIGISFESKVVMATIGRLIKRKGVAWFVENVVPRLGDKYVYLIGGHGPEYETIKNLLQECRLCNQVILLGEVADELRNLIYHAADIFIMPNISVKGDPEGFGIAILEAGAAGLPVVASCIEGIRDAVIDGHTGYFVAEKDVEGFIHGIRDIRLNRVSVARCVSDRFDWQVIVEKYREVLSV